MRTFSAKQDAADFAAWLLKRAPLLECAAAAYSPVTGKVVRVDESRARLDGIEHIERVAGWCRFKNANQHNIWIRPHRDLDAHPLLMLDDIPVDLACAIPGVAAIVETSTGNSQAWFLADRPLTREQRQNCVRALVSRHGGDPGAISEPRWGRWPGFKQTKPGKAGWTNLLLLVDQPPLLDPTPLLLDFLPPQGGGGGVFIPPRASSREHRQAVDRSAQHFAYACHALRAGVPSATVVQRVASRALQDGKRTTEPAAQAYAEQTVSAATRSVVLS